MFNRAQPPKQQVPKHFQSSRTGARVTIAIIRKLRMISRCLNRASTLEEAEEEDCASLGRESLSSDTRQRVEILLAVPMTLENVGQPSGARETIIDTLIKNLLILYLTISFFYAA
ncbi:hypothetical protein TcasGA2_TC006491 [Tribolium castaneum]|uniref:Uncharacterized protein n=1 Tax=Tribolium castaneum TaxID=7070 RepID=D6WX62_TRICA|nr:hypothetical protein TcasGA2_TC006491 [Tribolium castaneum]